VQVPDLQIRHLSPFGWFSREVRYAA